MKVPLLDLKLQYQSIREDVDRAIARVVESQYFILGPEVEKLEKEICAYLGSREAVAVSSGTDALLLALMAIDIRPGDEIIVPDYSFFATAGVVSRLNAVPVFCDIDPMTFNIDAGKMESLVTAKTRAIIPVHLFGQAADMDAIMAVASRHGLIVIEDAAQAIGACYRDGRALGTIGALGCFSFFPSKNLGCFGDGGMVTTNDAGMAEKLRVLRVHGSKPKYVHRMIGGNFRMDALQAVVLGAKLPHLAGWTRGRRKNADLYTRLFLQAGLAKGTGHVAFDNDNQVLLPEAVYENSGATERSDRGGPAFFHIYNQYVICVERRDDLKEFLTGKGIGCEIYYPIPFHRQECFRPLESPAQKSGREWHFPHSAFAAEKSLALPIFPELTEEQISYVVDCVEEFMSSSNYPAILPDLV